MNAVWKRLAIVAKTKLPLLILGETGCGKEIAAEWAFGASGRGTRLLKLNCATLTQTLVESELFGHVRGAFTGAFVARPGIFEAAHGGTLFLDEIGELPLETQAKLLRVLETGEVLRVGSNEPHRVDVRIIAATHRDLSQRAAMPTFRQDLYFRLNGITVRMPPLRERPTEIMPLARLFAQRCASATGCATPAIALCAQAALRAHSWPGNVRELRHVIERGVALCEGGPVLAEHLELSPSSESEETPRYCRSPSLRQLYTHMERSEVLSALEQTGGNQTRAARLLGISRRTLTNKLNVHGLPRPRKLA